MFNGDSAIGFCAVLAIILFFTKALGLIFRHYGLPQVLGFIIAGLIIGPKIFGDFCGFSFIGFKGEDYWCLISLSEDNALAIFSKIGVLLLMFSVGLETNIDDLKHTGLAAVLVACAGVAVPLLFGFLLSFGFGNIGLGTENIFRCLFIGTILTATSVAITVSVLKELGKVNTRLGTVIVSAAIIDDVLGIILLSIVKGVARSGAVEAANGFEAFKSTIYGTIIMIIAFFVFAIAMGWVLSKGFKWLDKRWPATHRIPIFSIAVCFGYSFIAEEIFGVADITGAFLAGVVLSTAHRASEYVDEQVEVDTYTIFAPVFFANIGITSITFKDVNGSIILFAVLAVLLGLIGKVIGCGGVCKAFGYSWRESAIGGVGMMARGEVALIVTSAVTDTALGANALPPEFMLMTVLLILVSSVITPVLLKFLYSREKPPLPPLSQGGGEAPDNITETPADGATSESAEASRDNSQN